MFSGIIQDVGIISKIQENTNFRTYTVNLPKKIIFNLKVGSSIANNGCCLTVIAIKNNLVSFNLIHETLKITNMKILQVGDLINIETPIKYNSKIDGHLMTGHIDCTGEIKKVINNKDNTVLWIELKNKYFQKYIFSKGSIGIDGVSLTINKVLNNFIRVCLTPYTIAKTNLGIKKIGDVINIEIDLIVKTITHTVEKLLHQRSHYIQK